RALSDAVDRAVEGIWQRIGPQALPDAAALVAVGGYGRRELAPSSDIDLMVLHAGAGSHGSKAVVEAAEALFYELWDSGMQVGHSVRTLKEALGIAKVDLSAETAFLDARLVTGDQTLFDRFLAGTLAQTRRSRPPFLDRIRVATEERYRRAGEAYGALEPNLKDGRGGLRDYQTIGWVSKVCNLSGSYEPERLMDAVGRVHLVRTALHDVTGRHTDSLAVQWQPQVAAALGEAMDPSAVQGGLHGRPGSGGPSGPTGPSGTSGPSRTSGPTGTSGPEAEERLMRMVYESCRTISYSLDTVLDPEAAAALADLPAELREGEWTEKGLRAFLDLLASGGVAVPVLRALDETGALVRLLAGWEHVRCLPQRNIYHRWPVDLHSFETVAALAAFAPFAPGQAREPRPEEGPAPVGIFRRALAREAAPSAGQDQAGGAGAGQEHRPDWQDLTRRVAADAAGDWDRLLVAALLHDIGKGDGEDHSTRGERLAREAAVQMGMPAPDAEEIAWLVRQHLTLTTTAVRRNVDDESLVVELAEIVGSVGRLRLLYLLSVADGLATGPAAWTPWRATLVGDLFTRVFHLLDRGELVSQRASLLAKARSADLREALSSFPPEDVERHLGAMPRAWLLSQSTHALVTQSRIMLRVAPGRMPHLEAHRFAEPDVWEVVVVAPDRPGLFSKVSGVLALHGLNVLTAQIFTRADGVALEVFRVTGTGERFDRVARDVAKALRGRISLDVRLDEKRQQYAGRVAKGARQAPHVTVDNGISDFYTVIEVHATDRVGLLYAITRALADLELDVHLAKVATYGEDVVDAFYVRDLEGQKVSDPEHVQEIERTILHKLGRAESRKGVRPGETG
ncbi:MAG TPA: ACT domain-containing protein, partial [Actinomycetota bacterium]